MSGLPPGTDRTVDPGVKARGPDCSLNNKKKEGSGWLQG
jgi:hypothetical protein